MTTKSQLLAKIKELQAQVDAMPDEMIMEAYWPILDALERAGCGESCDAGMVATTTIAALYPLIRKQVLEEAFRECADLMVTARSRYKDERAEGCSRCAQAIRELINK